METIIIGAILSFIITFFALPILIQFAKNRKIFVVRHFRKVHKDNVSALGGIAIFSAVFFVMLFFSDLVDFKPIRYYLAAGVFIFFVGLRDDLKNINPIEKLLGQLIASLIIIILGEVRISQIIISGTSYPIDILYSSIISLVLIVWIINAYNFFDGIDMQAALIGMVYLAPAGIWFYYTQQYNFSLLLLATAASLSAFLIFNYSPSKIFMGDTGTVTIGFILAFAFIKFTTLNFNHDFTDYTISNPFIFALFAMQLPLFDSLRVIIIRIFNRRNPMKADKNHLHHILLKMNWSHPKIAFTTAGYSLIMLIFNYLLFKLTSKIELLIILNTSIITLFYLVIFYSYSRISKSKSGQ